MSSEGTAIVLIPGGEKLLENVENTGRMLVDDLKLTEALGELITAEELRKILDGHAKLGRAMIAAVERTRRKMNGA